MATVIGKTSSRIDALLAPLLKTAAVIDGNLVVTQYDGTVVNAGGVGSGNSVQRIFYSSGAYPGRPSGALCIQWVGPVQPPNMTTNDDWFQAL